MGQDFPAITKPSSRQRTVSRPQIKSEFEAGYAQIRARGTRVKRSWTLSWNLMSLADWDMLVAHFTTNTGDSFTISKEMLFESKDYVVMYSIDEIAGKSTSTKGRYSVEIKVEEM